MNQELFQRDYPGFQVVLEDIVYPVFGNAATINENILADNTILNKAAETGIKKATRIAEYDVDGTPLNIFDVELNDSVDISRSRIKIKRWLISHADVYSASLIFFHYDAVAGKEWRISFFAKNATNSDVTSAKRYTFLCGQEHGCRTVAQRFELLRKSQLTLDKIREAFSVEALNKEFYAKLSNWFFWALQHVKFPEKESQVPLIRLITRTIFVWFMRRKELIPAELFDKKYIDSILKKDCDASSYYKAILQNLFFATLNTEQDTAENRKFQVPEHAPGRNHQYHVYTCYRYEDFFTDTGKEQFLKLVKNIPFLNGGLFSCLDDNEDKTIIDAFSNHPANREKLFVPDELFWTTEEDNKIVNLNDIYGDKKHGKEKVLGLIPLLSQYNFTINESSRDEFTVALDPELLGMVFENLLASYNPETSVTAKKSTGSFYTPRDIVDYMVEESLCRYILNSIPACGLTEDDVRDLVASDNHPNFTKEQKHCVTEAINNCKILDPACGSGAFPIGLLQNLVRILEKLNPVGCQKDLYERKLHLIQNCIYGVDIQPIAVQISKLRCFISLLAESEVDGQQANCGIEPLPNLEMHFVAANSLIDVNLEAFDWTSDTQVQKLTAELQEIRARYFSVKTHTEKKKLRKEDKTKREELKKLLVSLSSTGNAEKVCRLEKELADLKTEMAKYLEEKWEDSVNDDLFASDSESLFRIDVNKAKRDQLTKKLNKCQKELEKEKAVVTDTINQEAAKLADWNPFNQMASSPFFNPRWMFNIKDGFNIVIGNPPYIDSELMTALDEQNGTNFRAEYAANYQTAKGNWDIYVIFFELSMNLLNSTGVTSFITPNKWLSIDYGEALRLKYLENIYLLCDCSKVKVFEAGNTPVVSFFNKIPTSHIAVEYFVDGYVRLSQESVDKNLIPNKNLGVCLSENLSDVLNIYKMPHRVDDYVHVENPFTTKEAYELIPFISDISNPSDASFKLINTGTIDPYTSLWGKKQTSYLKHKYLYPYIKKSDFKNHFPKRFIQENSEKIVITGLRHFECFWDQHGDYIAGKSTLLLRGLKTTEISFAVLLAILNSSVIKFYLKECYSSSGIDGGINFSAPMVQQLPFPEITDKEKEQLISFVKQITAAKSANLDADTSALEAQIDNLVTQLYGISTGVK